MSDSSNNNKNNPILIQSDTDYLFQAGDFVRKHTQNISQAFLDDLKDARNESTGQKMGEFHRVASIPTAVVEKWLREGFNIWEASGPEIVKRLKAEDLQMFMATDRRI